MPYSIEVKLADGFDKTTGVPLFKRAKVHPTGGAPYVFSTLAEASRMRAICYPDQTADEVRIVEVQA